MFRFNFLAAMLTCLLISPLAGAAAAKKTVKSKPRAKPPAAAKTMVVDSEIKNPPAPPVRVISRLALGFSYTLWNENIQLSEGGVKNDGVANYGGYIFSLEKFWMSAWWLYDVRLAYGLGKASTGSFDAATPAFADGVNRAWWSADVSGSALYRINTVFMAGVGAFFRNRNVDLEPKSASLGVEAPPNFQFGPEIILRWRVNGRFSFLQTYSFLNFKDSSKWTWTAQIEI